MRILLVNTLFPPVIKGGAEVSTSNLGAALAARGHDVHVLTITPDPETVAQQNGMTVHRINPSIVRYPFDHDDRGGAGKLVFHAIDNYNPRMYTRARSLIEEIRPDIVHTNILQLLTCSIWFAAKAAGARVVHNLRDYWLLCARSGFFRNDEPCSRKCLDCAIVSSPRRLMTGKVDGVVAVGQYVLDTHLAAKLFPNVKVARAILSATDPIEPLQKPSRRADDPITLGYIGRIKESKGVRVLLEAIRQVPAESKVRLLIAGDGDGAYMQTLRALADDRVEFLGWCSPKDFYSRVDVVVVPSLYPEPLPRTVLEAYRYGLPVIGARSGGIPEVVHDGVTGWLYAPDNVDGLAALIRALPGPSGLSKLSSGERDTVVARTNPDYVVKQYEDVYRLALR